MNSFNKSSSHLPPILAVAILTMLACGSAAERAGETSADLTGSVPLAVPSDWAGYQLGLSPPRLVTVGRTDVAPPSSASPDNLTIVPAKAPPSPAKSDLVRVGRDGTVQKVLFSDDDMNKIGDLWHKLGRDLGSSVQTAPDVEKAFANGKDDRVYWSLPGDFYPRDTIGKMTQGCTGVRFSNQLVMTALHCLYGSSGFNWSYTFSPGWDGPSNPPYPDPSHYVGQHPNTVWYPSGWANNNCQNPNPPGSESTTCQAYDWAMVVMTPGDQSLGWMGWWWAGDSTVESWSLWTAGYPGSGPCAPAGYTDLDYHYRMFYSGSCQAGSFFNNFSEPLGGSANNRNFNFGCSTSSGDSGSPVYSYSPTGTGPVIAGVFITSPDCSQSQPYPNQALRIDQGMSNLMASLQSMYP